MSLKEYANVARRMVKDAGNRCEICQISGDETKLCVDHCHQTGRRRGMLCNACNLSIGYMQDDKNRLMSAIRYLHKKSGSKTDITVNLEAAGCLSAVNGPMRI